MKGRFPKGWFWRTYPRSGFRSGGTSAKTTLLETTLLRTPEHGMKHLLLETSIAIISLLVPLEQSPCPKAPSRAVQKFIGEFRSCAHKAAQNRGPAPSKKLVDECVLVCLLACFVIQGSDASGHGKSHVKGRIKGCIKGLPNVNIHTWPQSVCCKLCKLILPSNAFTLSTSISQTPMSVHFWGFQTDVKGQTE